MRDKTITDNAGEKITIRWDGERFILKREAGEKTSVIILNPKEMADLVKFIQELRDGSK